MSRKARRSRKEKDHSELDIKEPSSKRQPLDQSVQMKENDLQPKPTCILGDFKKIYKNTKIEDIILRALEEISMSSKQACMDQIAKYIYQGEYEPSLSDEDFSRKINSTLKEEFKKNKLKPDRIWNIFFQMYMYYSNLKFGVLIFDGYLIIEFMYQYLKDNCSSARYLHQGLNILHVVVNKIDQREFTLYNGFEECLIFVNLYDHLPTIPRFVCADGARQAIASIKGPCGLSETDNNSSYFISSIMILYLEFVRRTKQTNGKKSRKMFLYLLSDEKKKVYGSLINSIFYSEK